MTHPSPVYAIFAGNGDLPLLLRDYFIKHNLKFVVFTFDGMTHQNFGDNVSIHCVPIGEIGKILSLLKKENVTHITMAGQLLRPSLSNLKLDFKGALWLAKIGAKAFGDDGLLSSLIALIEKENFTVIPPHSLLPTLCEVEGALTKTTPSQQNLEDMERGIAILNALSPLDVGQSVVIEKGVVLGIEAIEGTKNLLHRMIPYTSKNSSGVLVKLPKINQSMMVDLPTIGPDTIDQCLQAHLQGIIIAHKGTQILHYNRCIEKANEHHFFIFSIPHIHTQDT